MKKVDFGCGVSKRDGYIGVDILPLKGVDIVHNLSEFPYPFSDNELDEIWMDQVLEHITNPLRVVEELYRIGKPGAKVHIGVPYFRSAYAAIDPTHVNFFGVFWFNYFDPSQAFHHKYQYSPVTYHIDRIEFDREFKNRSMSFFKRCLVRYAERNPQKYELAISHLFPLNSLTYHLTILK